MAEHLSIRSHQAPSFRLAAKSQRDYKHVRNTKKSPTLSYLMSPISFLRIILDKRKAERTNPSTTKRRPRFRHQNELGTNKEAKLTK